MADLPETPPRIPPEVVEFIEKTFPVRNPVPDTSHDRIMYAAGQASVGIFLRSLLTQADREDMTFKL